MAEQILSQEEIDALLSAMDSGELDVAEEKQEVAVEVCSYDLTAQNIMQRGQFDALEEVTFHPVGAGAKYFFFTIGMEIIDS